MRGRDYFKLFKLLIKIFVIIFKFMPNSCTSIIWALLDCFHGKIGLGLRYCILKAKARECGDCVFVGPNVEIRNMKNLYVGNNVSIHRFSYLDAIGEIHIGNNVSVAHNCSLVSFEHTWADKTLPIRDNPIVKGPILLEDDVWIGCGVRVLSGVSIASRCVVAAGSVVNKNLESGYLYVGVPAKPIKRL